MRYPKSKTSYQLPLLFRSKHFVKALLVFSLFLNADNLHSAFKDHYKRITEKTDGHGFGPIDFVYLINLDHRPEKYQESLEEFLPYDIHPFRFSAVNGWKIPHSVVQEIGMTYNNSMRGGGCGTTYVWDDGKEYSSHGIICEPGVTYFCHCMSRGAIGCYMSHASILKDAYESGYELIWILEDDAEVVQDPALLISFIDELDSIVGRNNWDLFYTDRDYRTKGGYILSYGTDYRPDVETRNQEKYNIDRRISKNLRQMGSRFGTHSMIWTRAGIKKFLDYIESHGIFLPIDMDVHLTPNLQIYSVLRDVVTNRLSSISDIGRNAAEATVTK